MTFQELLVSARAFLKAHSLATQVADYLLLNQLNWNEALLIFNYQKIVSSTILNTYAKNLYAYYKGEMPQYIIGTSNFYGHQFIVNNHVLIPRFETEELVELVLKTNDNKVLKVLDFGTGSGNIALSLKLARPKWQLVASDISKAALSVAKENANRLHTSVEFCLSNAFTNIKDKFDVIVANPPYIDRYAELNMMDARVIRNEPAKALFAKDQGLYFYYKLAKAIPKHLNKKGQMYLEIGMLQAQAVRKIFQAIPQVTQVEILKDINRHDRLVHIKL